jgi:hypothetical protein
MKFLLTQKIQQERTLARILQLKKALMEGIIARKSRFKIHTKGMIAKKLKEHLMKQQKPKEIPDN